jgi:hypothetical protein
MIDRKNRARCRWSRLVGPPPRASTFVWVMSDRPSSDVATECGDVLVTAAGAASPADGAAGSPGSHAGAAAAAASSSASALAAWPAFAHQVAGHGTTCEDGAATGDAKNSDRLRAFRRRKADFLLQQAAAAAATALDEYEPTILKPVPSKPKGLREIAFYVSVEAFRVECSSPSPQRGGAQHPAAEWLDFFPRYYGTMQQSENGELASVPVDDRASAATSNFSRYLHLEDLVTSSFAHPSIVDVKIGRFSHDPFECAAVNGSSSDPNASHLSAPGSAKILREAAKCPSQRHTGFRICGARIWHQEEQQYEVRGKEWCRDLPLQPTELELEEPFWTYLTGRTAQAAAVLPSFISRLETLRRLCVEQPRWRFYASSILLCYEYSSEAPRAQLHLIDFSHAYPLDASGDGQEAERDENYIAGVESLLRIFQRMLARCTNAS